MTEPFDFDQALKDLQSGKDLTGKDGVLMPLIKQTDLFKTLQTSEWGM